MLPKQQGTSQTKAKPPLSQVTASSLHFTTEPCETPHPPGVTTLTGTHSRHSGHTNAGTGGHLAQLEKIGQALEGMPGPPRLYATVSDGELVNVMAPTPCHLKRRKVTSTNPSTKVHISIIHNHCLMFCNLGIHSSSCQCWHQCPSCHCCQWSSRQLLWPTTLAPSAHVCWVSVGGCIRKRVPGHVCKQHGPVPY